MERVENVCLAGCVRSVNAVDVVDVICPRCALGRAECLEGGACQVEGCFVAERSMVLKRESKEMHSDMVSQNIVFDTKYRKMLAQWDQVG
jgi:hypothetical protein